MFGFLVPQQSVPEWRRSYARICQVQRQLFGLTSLPFLSYEAAFLYQLAIDLQLIPALDRSSPLCCRLRRLDRQTALQDTAAVYAAAFGMLLAGVKLRDDVQDSGRWYHRLLQWKYRRQTRKADRVLASFAPHLADTVTLAIERHARLEHAQQWISIEDYCEPTSGAFAATFAGLTGALTGDVSPVVHEQLTQAGRLAGGAIIAWDCAVDYERDRIRGEFNPLRGRSDVADSFSFCLLQLAQLGWSLPSNSSSARVIAGVVSRVRQRSQRQPAADGHRRLERWGLLREKGYAYARCDGCDVCCEIGACGDCFCAGGDAASACAASDCGPPAGCCLPLDCADCAGCYNSQDQQKPQESTQSSPTSQPYAAFEGRNAITHGLLNPAGYVIIDEQRLPAKSQSGCFIDEGATVRIISSDAWGVHVTPVDSDS